MKCDCGLLSTRQKTEVIKQNNFMYKKPNVLLLSCSHDLNLLIYMIMYTYIWLPGLRGYQRAWFVRFFSVVTGFLGLQ
jgi:hypothetical protein